MTSQRKSQRKSKRKTLPARRSPQRSQAKKATFNLPTSLLDRLRRASVSEDRPQSSIVRRALEAYLGKSR